MEPEEFAGQLSDGLYQKVPLPKSWSPEELIQLWCKYQTRYSIHRALWSLAPEIL